MHIVEPRKSKICQKAQILDLVPKGVPTGGLAMLYGIPMFTL